MNKACKEGKRNTDRTTYKQIKRWTDDQTERQTDSDTNR